MKAPIVSGLARAKHEYGRLLVARHCATASSKTLEVVPLKHWNKWRCQPYVPTLSAPSSTFPYNLC